METIKKEKPSRFKSVTVLTKDGVVVETLKSVSEAVKKYGNCNISLKCRGTKKQSGAFQFVFTDSLNVTTNT